MLGRRAGAEAKGAAREGAIGSGRAPRGALPDCAGTLRLGPDTSPCHKIAFYRFWIAENRCFEAASSPRVVAEANTRHQNAAIAGRRLCSAACHGPRGPSAALGSLPVLGLRPRDEARWGRASGPATVGVLAVDDDVAGCCREALLNLMKSGQEPEFPKNRFEIGSGPDFPVHSQMCLFAQSSTTARAAAGGRVHRPSARLDPAELVVCSGSARATGGTPQARSGDASVLGEVVGGREPCSAA